MQYKYLYKKGNLDTDAQGEHHVKIGITLPQAKNYKT